MEATPTATPQTKNRNLIANGVAIPISLAMHSLAAIAAISAAAIARHKNMASFSNNISVVTT